MDVTIQHKGLSESITLPIIEESGTPLFSVDVGYPELNIYESGELEPKFDSQRSQLEQYTLATQLHGASAYDDAITLADMIKSRTGNGEELTVEVSGDDVPTSYPTTETLVAPAAQQRRPLSLTYVPGRTNVVDVELQLTRVGRVTGNANQDAQTPTTTGDGPIRIARNGNSVEVSEGINVTRSVGRPNTSIRAIGRDYPNYTDPRKTANDDFSIEFQLIDDAQTKAETIKNDIFEPILERDAITLDFQGLFGMGAFDVVPEGSQAMRVQRLAAQKSIEHLPTMSFRRVQ